MDELAEREATEAARVDVIERLATVTREQQLVNDRKIAQEAAGLARARRVFQVRRFKCKHGNLQVAGDRQTET